MWQMIVKSKVFQKETVTLKLLLEFVIAFIRFQKKVNHMFYPDILILICFHKGLGWTNARPTCRTTITVTKSLNFDSYIHYKLNIM